MTRLDTSKEATAELGSASCREPLSAVSEQHLASVVAQLLRGVGIDDGGQWVPIVTRLATTAAACVSPPALAASGAIDPRFYIKASISALQQDRILSQLSTYPPVAVHDRIW